jgi:hypothetical protein
VLPRSAGIVVDNVPNKRRIEILYNWRVRLRGKVRCE